MKVNHKLELLDQFDDAAFALMMDEYAEAEGERLRMEFEEATRSGLTPAKPDTLDEKCRRQIRREFGKQRRREYAARGKSIALRAAACILVALCISATLIMSVEAIREPFWRAITKEYGDYFVLNFGSDGKGSTEANQLTMVEDPLLKHVPTEYRSARYEVNNGRISSSYIAEDGSWLDVDMQFCNEKSEDPYFYEDEFNTVIEILGNKASYGTGMGILQISWYDPDLETQFSIGSEGMDEDTFLIFCEKVAETFYYATIDCPSEVPNALEGHIPDAHISQVTSLYGHLHCYYETESGMKIIFDINEHRGSNYVYLEDAELIHSTCAGYDAVFASNQTERETFWIDEERNIVFSCYTVGQSEEDHLALCEYLAEYYKNVTLPAVSTVIWD